LLISITSPFFAHLQYLFAHFGNIFARLPILPPTIAHFPFICYNYTRTEENVKPFFKKTNKHQKKVHKEKEK